MFNTCCCGKDPQCTDQKYFTCGALQREAVRREYNTGEVTCPSAFTFPERAMKVTGHCRLQRLERSVQVAPNQSNASSVIAFHCTANLRPAETRCPRHTHVFLSHVRRHQVTIFPFRWMPETADAHPGEM